MTAKNFFPPINCSIPRRRKKKQRPSELKCMYIFFLFPVHCLKYRPPILTNSLWLEGLLFPLEWTQCITTRVGVSTRPSGKERSVCYHFIGFFLMVYLNPTLKGILFCNVSIQHHFACHHKGLNFFIAFVFPVFSPSYRKHVQ